MRRRVLAIASSLALLAAPAFAAPHTTTLPPASLATAAQLRDQALADDTGWKVVESLTTEIGPRIAGSEADARAVAWAEAKFKALGFDKVWKEPVTFPKWERRSEHAAVTGKNPQPLQITALGGSPGGTVEAEVVRFADLRLAGGTGRFAEGQDRLRRLPDAAVPRWPRLRPRRCNPQQGTVRSDPQGRGGLPDALGRYRLPPRAAHRHHPFR